MPVINKGTALSNGEQLTAEKLNDLLDLATFSQTATDSVSTFVNSSGQIAVLDGGIAATKLATNAVSTTKILDANVTFAKLTDVIDDDTMATATATTLATSESIKAYVDTFLGIKAHCVFNGTLTATNAPISGSGVTSVTRNSSGNWTINMSVEAPASTFTCLASSQAKSSGTTNNATGAYSTSTTTALVTREQADGSGADGDTPISFAAIW